MPAKNSKQKTRLHPRNKNRASYDLDILTNFQPSLEKYITYNRHGNKTIDFSDPRAVKLLNRAILNHYYKVQYWEFPDKNLCPPIPGRADYLHYMADMLSETNYGKLPTGDNIKCLDIGTGASCIYPLLGVAEYGWHFIGSEVDRDSLQSAEKIVKENELQDKIDIRLQSNKHKLVEGVLRDEEQIDLIVCNPPFHATIEEASESSNRKVKNLKLDKKGREALNFSGKEHELVYDRGEYGFIEKLVNESKHYAQRCLWFSTLVSKQSNVRAIEKNIRLNNTRQLKIIPMGTGNKSTRVVAWSYLSKSDMKEYANDHWR